MLVRCGDDDDDSGSNGNGGNNGNSETVGASISFTLLNVPALGTYPLIVPNSATLILGGNCTVFTTTLVPQKPGEFNVTEISGQRIQGTVDFRAAFREEILVVTEGNVKIPLSNDPFN